MYNLIGISQKAEKMEGWLYLIRSNRFGMQYSRKRYFILRGNSLDCYKSVPTLDGEEPVRRALVDSCVRVTENGRESTLGNVFYIFTLYNASNHSDQLKLGARSSEEAAEWVRTLMEATLKDCPHKGEKIVACSGKGGQSLRLKNAKSRRMNSVDWTIYSSVHTDPIVSDVIAPSPWTIIGCTNGLRMFKETRDGDLHGKTWDDHPAVMAVGVVDASPEAIFQALMSLGPSRSEWDFCVSHGKVVEHLDGHTDIIHKKLRSDWLPRGMKKRDLLLRRYWRREDDGTYVIVYHSANHHNCQPDRGFTRACLKSGGYVISPVSQGSQSVVKHMLAIDWKSWRSYILASSAEYITIRMLARVAALRELFRAKLGDCACFDHSSAILTRKIALPQSEQEDIKVEVESGCDGNNEIGYSAEVVENHSVNSTNMGELLLQLGDAVDEFFDVPDPGESEYDQSEAMWPCNGVIHSQDQHNSTLSSGAALVRKLHDLAVQKKGYVELQEASKDDELPWRYGTTLPNDPKCNITCSWTTADPSTFLIRSESYLQDHHKIKANSTLMQLVAADWLSSDKREDDLGGRSDGIVQKYAIQDASKFFFVINLQIPGSTRYNLALYYMLDTPLEDAPLLDSFVKGDDAYRNSRFKLIPYISKGSWIVKQSVGKKAALLGQALEINYFKGSNYLELDVDVGSSTVARSVVSLVLSYLNNLVIEMAFVLQANTQEELPEILLGTCRLNHLNDSKAVPVN